MDKLKVIDRLNVMKDAHLCYDWEWLLLAPFKSGQAFCLQNVRQGLSAFHPCATILG